LRSIGCADVLGHMDPEGGNNRPGPQDIGFTRCGPTSRSDCQGGQFAAPEGPGPPG